MSDHAAIAARRAAREAVLAALYADQAGGAVEAPPSLGPVAARRVAEEVEAVSSGAERLDGLYEAYLAPGWSVGRLAAIDRLLLRMACWEFWEAPDVPPKVTLAEHVALARRFGDKESSGFVHAVLSQAMQACPKWSGAELEPEEEGWAEPGGEPEDGEDGEPGKPGLAWTLRDP